MDIVGQQQGIFIAFFSSNNVSNNIKYRCNCVACMKLDIEARKLGKGYLVNNEGFTARKGTTGKYYCGRKIGNSIGNWDGYCGPTNGDNCKPCKTLDKLGHIRYKKIL